MLYVPDADSELPVTESPKSAPPCMESGSFTESVETIRSSSVSHVSQVRCGRKERGGIRGEEIVVGVLSLCQFATSLLRREGKFELTQSFSMVAVPSCFGDHMLTALRKGLQVNDSDHGRYLVLTQTYET